MRIVVLRLVLTVVLLAGTPAVLANAEPDALAPREFLALPHVDPAADAHFTHSSKITSNGSDLVAAEYAICNLASEPLIYSWHGPNIRLGPGGRLPSEECDIVRRSLCDVEHDYRASILYTQAWRPHMAEAHVSPAFCSFTARELTSGIKRLLIGEEWTTPGRAALEMEVTQTASNEGVRHVIRWHPPEVWIALSAGAFPGQEAEAVAGALNEQGHEARVAVLSDLLRPEDQESVPAERLNETVIELRRTLTPEGVDFETPYSPSSIVTAAASAIHPDFGLLFDIEISVFGE